MSESDLSRSAGTYKQSWKRATNELGWLVGSSDPIVEFILLIWSPDSVCIRLDGAMFARAICVFVPQRLLHPDTTNNLVCLGQMFREKSARVPETCGYTREDSVDYARSLLLTGGRLSETVRISLCLVVI